MPPISQIKQSEDFEPLKDKLRATPADGVDETFDVDQEFSFNEARSAQDHGLGKWVGVTVTLHNFVIGEETGGSGAVGSDDVQYVGICKCPSPRAVHTAEYTNLEEGDDETPGSIFGAFSPLQGGPVRFGVYCDAFNNDSSEAWEGIVEALDGDITNATNLGADLLPGLSQFETPGRIGSAIGALVRAALTDLPVEVGDEPICDTINAVNWYRKLEQSRWTARSWVIHTLDHIQAWYLSQWFITLDTTITTYDYSSRARSGQYAQLRDALQREPERTQADLAAIRFLGGEPLPAVAERFGLRESTVLSARNSLRAVSAEELSARVHAAVLMATDQREGAEEGQIP